MRNAVMNTLSFVTWAVKVTVPLFIGFWLAYFVFALGLMR